MAPRTANCTCFSVLPPPLTTQTTDRGWLEMRKNLIRGLLIAAFAVWKMLASDAYADPWHSERGLASHYGREFQGKKTANGERFSPSEMTAAHRKLPLGTKVMV